MNAPVVLDWGVRWRAIDGGPCCGDHYLVHAGPAGTLVAVVDGLGHGPEASEAAVAACETLRGAPPLPLADLVQLTHEALRSSRGAVLSLALLHGDEAALSWVGVGNVEGRLWQGERSHSLMLRGGVVGSRLPPLRVERIELQAGDTLVMVTDGIRHTYTSEPSSLPPQALADRILEQHGKTSDDALVLVARYQGRRQGATP